MDLKEIKKLTHFARKAGVKSISVADIRIEFKDEIILQRGTKPRLVPAKEEKTIPVPEIPTLEQINDWIYKDTEAS